MLPRVGLLSLAALAGCQGESSHDSSPKAPAASIEVREANGKVSGRVTPGHPCRASIDGFEMLIGTQPLVAQMGDVRWSGDLTASGTMLRRNDIVMARVYPDNDPGELGLYTAEGVAMFHAKIVGDKADLVSGAGAIVATAQKQRGPDGGVKVGERMVTGTDDVLLAAVLAAPDAPPEVRGLAACHRLFPPAKAAP